MDRHREASKTRSNTTTTAPQPPPDHFDRDESKPFRYRPLDRDAQEIRLLRILPGSWDDELRLEIFHTPLVAPGRAPDTRMDIEELQKTLPEGWVVEKTIEGRYVFWDGRNDTTHWAHPDPKFDKELCDSPAVLDPYPGFEPRYEALSYAWGVEDANQVVYLTSESLEGSGTFSLRRNLYSALQHLREAESPRVVWVDAICINQDDLEERNIEVKKMGQIYTLAFRVVVWLGPDQTDLSGKRALSVLESLGKHIEYTQSYAVFPSPTSLLNLWDLQQELPHNDNDYLSVSNILQRSWWDRLWIWQEIFLGNHETVIQCGSRSALWYFVRRDILLLNDRRQRGDVEITDKLPRSLLSTRAGLCKPSTQSRLLDILEGTQNAQYSREHDRIFALFGIMDPGFTALVKADYTLPITDLFVSMCLSYFNYYGNLSLLVHCYKGHADFAPNQPSWVPNFLKLPPLKRFISGFASGESGSGSTDHGDGLELTVFGVLCGQVQQRSIPAPMEGDIVGTLRSWKFDLRKDDLEEEVQQMDFVMAMACGETKERLPGYEFPSIQQYLESYREDVPMAADCVRGRSCFRSVEGHVGICSSASHEGDVIAVIIGFHWPIILRPCMTTDSTTKYQVVGPAYVDKLMGGEALLGSLPKDYTWRREFDSEGGAFQAFIDSKSGRATYDDPRLGLLPEGWKFARHYEPREKAVRGFRNTKTGEKTYKDPRLSVEELRRKDVDVQKVTLI
ncbi:HET-domain-containing protein [Byssothecium circinans]|uniref:HET-domain-containing protein n=1 Tax=Byssothecium circinans TaxID=147558 RepID=A0A6A5UBN4_9PLEO|nr:HET-domain-containing protein [Byssothecium circinans]